MTASALVRKMLKAMSTSLDMTKSRNVLPVVVNDLAADYGHDATRF